MILLNLAGGSCVDDLDILNADQGFCKILSRIQSHGLKRKERRKLEQRWRKEKKRFVPSPLAMFRYLSRFHDPDQEKPRQSGKAFQPLNTWWAQQNVILHTQFRDGNVPAGYKQLKVFKQALRCLPKNVGQVNLRSDTAGYQHDLLHYCETGHSKKGPEYRYLAKRQLMSDQQALPGMQKEQMSLPFPTMNLEDKQNKVLGIVTNISESKMNGEDIIHWLHQRCGKSEQVHSVMKKDLASGTSPSNDFGKNAAW